MDQPNLGKDTNGLTLTKDATWLRTVVGRIEEGYPEIPDESVDLAVFSPPYFECDGYSVDLMQKTRELLYRVMKPGARAYMVFGQIVEQLDRPFEAQAILSGREWGSEPALKSAQTIIWLKSFVFDGVQKGHYTPINSKDLLNYGFEYVFGFTKGKKPARALNRKAIGVPFTDKTNLKRGTRGKDGDVHCAGDCWFIPYTTVQSSDEKGHRHGFPLELARRCVILSGIPEGSVVMDPYLGGGTTAVAARLCGMNAYGGDRDGAAVQKARKEWGSREGERWQAAVLK